MCRSTVEQIESVTYILKSPCTVQDLLVFYKMSRLIL